MPDYSKISRPGLIPVKIENKGDLITTQVNKINFSGAGVVASVGNFNDVLIEINGGGSTNTGSLLTNASFSNPNLTFTRGNGTTFNVNLITLVPTSASYALSSSYAATASSADTFIVRNQLTASGLNYPTADNGEFSFMQTDGNGNLSLQYVNTLYETIYNGESTSIVKGTPVYVSGSVGANSKVYRADAGNPSKMPVIYIAADNIPSGNTGRGIALGLITGVDTTGYPAGTEVYVAVGGGWTPVRPTGSAIVQILGIVTKEGSGGQGIVLNPGPVNLPNLPSGSFWVGNSGSFPVAVPTASLSVATASFAVNALTASFVNPLTQSVNISGSLITSGSSTFTEVVNSPRLQSLTNVNTYISLAGGGGAFIDFRANNSPIARMSSGGMFIGSDTTPTSRLQVRGTGTTNATTAFRVENANASASLSVDDNRQVTIGTNLFVENGRISLKNSNDSVIIGFGAATNSSANFNTIVGQSAAANLTTGGANTVFGFQSLFTATTGVSNLAIGQRALGNAGTSISFNLAIGDGALRYITSGLYNTVIGRNAVSVGSASFSNITAVGYEALLSNIASNNTAIGYRAGFNNTSGSNNIFIGYQSDGVSATESNRTWIGNTSTTSTWLAGNVLIGTTTTSSFKLNVSGSSNFTGDTIITGSLTVSGSITGSLFGTASQAVSASYAPSTPTFPYTGSALISGSLDVSGSIYSTAVISAAGNIESQANLRSMYQSGDEGGEIFLNAPATNTTIPNGVTIDVYQNRLRIFEQGGTANGYYLDMPSGGAGVGTNLKPAGYTGIITIIGNPPPNNLNFVDGILINVF